MTPTGKSFRFVRACVRAGGRRARDQLRLSRWICGMIVALLSSLLAGRWPEFGSLYFSSFLKKFIVLHRAWNFFTVFVEWATFGSIFLMFCFARRNFFFVDWSSSMFSLWRSPWKVFYSLALWIESKNRMNESNQWMEAMNRTNESNQRIESMNRITESRDKTRSCDYTHQVTF